METISALRRIAAISIMTNSWSTEKLNAGGRIYTSSQHKGLDVEGTKQKMLTTQYVQSQLEAMGKM